MEPLRHECGVAMIRLRKPLDYYREKYGTELYGLERLLLMMQKEFHRGQEGAGMACVKLRGRGEEKILRRRFDGGGALQRLIDAVETDLKEADESESSLNPYIGEVYMGHLRYSTTGKSGLDHVHPFLRKGSDDRSTLLLCGNFNLTNIHDIAASVESELPEIASDTSILLSHLGAALEKDESASLREILAEKVSEWDGGFVICALSGSGDIAVVRDGHGIRPAFYYIDDEVAVVASERPVIQTVFNASESDVKELPSGGCLEISSDGRIELYQALEARQPAGCTFERIYFSRENDGAIYRERKELGRLLAPEVAEIIGRDFRNTVFSLVPNTAETAFLGLMEGLEKILNEKKIREISILAAEGLLVEETLRKVSEERLRMERVALKDMKLRTFIAHSEHRGNLANHIYDVAYGIVRPGNDTLVMVDDSIVRGTTLRQSLLRLLDRLGPKRIVIASSAPQIRYPDCYGIDMSSLGELVAFRAAVKLLEEKGLEKILDETYRRCLEEIEKAAKGSGEPINCVKDIYMPLSEEDITRKIAELVIPEGLNAEVKIVFQKVEDMARAMPCHRGDWYFTGNYPTIGGYGVVNRSFVDFYRKRHHKI